MSPRRMLPFARRTIALLGAVAALATTGVGHAQQLLESKVPISFERFYTFEELIDLTKRLAAAYPDLVRIEELGQSVQGRPIVLVTVNNPATGPDTAKPAMYIDGNIHGNEIQSSETVLYSLWYLLAAYGKVAALTELVDRAAFYFVVSANPDGRAYWFDQPNTSSSSRGGQKPVDNDRDGVADEDGPDDLDGDGSIGVMWRRDPNGTHRRSELDPTRLEPVSAEPTKDGRIRRGEYSFAGSEGIDNDGDGQLNEDGPGGYDPNRNWPADWQPDHVQDGAGDLPMSLPETQAVARFLLERPNVAAGQAYHNAGGMILRGPGAQDRESAYGGRDRATYDAIAKAGEEMLPFYRSMVIWSDLYPVRGGFVNFLAESLGAVTFTNELWSDKRINQTGTPPSEDEARRWRERVLFGQVTTPLTEVDHPTLGKVLVGGGTKWSSRIPPNFMLAEECHRNFAFTMFHAEQMPLLRLASTTVTPIGPRLWQVDVEIANDRLIPTRTERAAQRGIGQPDRLTLEGAKVLAAGVLRDRFARSMEEQRFRPQRLEIDEGVPGRGSRFARFLVEGDEGTAVRIAYEAEKAADLAAEIVLKASAPAGGG